MVKFPDLQCLLLMYQMLQNVRHTKHYRHLVLLQFRTAHSKNSQFPKPEAYKNHNSSMTRKKSKKFAQASSTVLDGLTSLAKQNKAHGNNLLAASVAYDAAAGGRGGDGGTNGGGGGRGADGEDDDGSQVLGGGASNGNNGHNADTQVLGGDIALVVQHAAARGGRPVTTLSLARCSRALLCLFISCAAYWAGRNSLKGGGNSSQDGVMITPATLELLARRL